MGVNHLTQLEINSENIFPVTQEKFYERYLTHSDLQQYVYQSRATLQQGGILIKDNVVYINLNLLMNTSLENQLVIALPPTIFGKGLKTSGTSITCNVAGNDGYASLSSEICRCQLHYGDNFYRFVLRTAKVGQYISLNAVLLLDD
ncbi:hypothetical protein A4S06_05410 [Erysipelotrichaceae bacterium MTC7]|nr:hypothetical protein A4S06_05410 [Erysipelotrichaceae bacterium MTC7]